MRTYNYFRVNATVAAGLLFSSGCALQASDPAAHIISYEEFATAEQPSPYVRSFSTSDGELCLVGVIHTFDARSQTTKVIWSEWHAFKPTVAFFEGTGWEMGMSQDVVGAHGEPAYLRFLAFTSRVPVTSIEPDLVEEITHLQASWSDTQIRVFYTLRWIAQRVGAYGQPPNDDEITTFLRSWFPRMQSFAQEPASSAALGQDVGTLLPRDVEWKRPSPKWFDPRHSDTFLNSIARESGQFRDRRILKTLLRETQSGERVFLAVGSDHVHMLEPALAQVLDSSKSAQNEAQQCVAADAGSAGSPANAGRR